jgi:hypothetical protein
VGRQLQRLQHLSSVTALGTSGAVRTWLQAMQLAGCAQVHTRAGSRCGAVLQHSPTAAALLLRQSPGTKGSKRLPAYATDQTMMGVLAYAQRTAARIACKKLLPQG